MAGRQKLAEDVETFKLRSKPGRKVSGPAGRVGKTKFKGGQGKEEEARKKKKSLIQKLIGSSARAAEGMTGAKLRKKGWKSVSKDEYAKLTKDIGHRPSVGELRSFIAARRTPSIPAERIPIEKKVEVAKSTAGRLIAKWKKKKSAYAESLKAEHSKEVVRNYMVKQWVEKNPPPDVKVPAD